MNKPRIIIFIAVVIAILGIGAYWIFSGTGVVDTGTGGDNIPGSFPTGGDVNIPGRPSGDTGGQDTGAIGGEDDGTGTGVGTGTGGDNLFVSDKKTQLIQLTQSATSGAGVGTSTVRYVEKSTGHIYEIGFDGKNRHRLSNSTILKTFDSYWSPTASKLVLRYFEDGVAYPALKNFSASVPAVSLGTTTMPINGVFIPQTIRTLAVSPAEDKIFYLDWSSGTAVGMTADYNNSNKKTLFTFPFGDFNASWPGKNFISLLTRPSYSAEGTLYLVDTRVGKMEKVLGGMEGLTALVSPDGEKIVYNRVAGRGGVETLLLNRKDGQTNSFGLGALPEKCVWSLLDKDLAYCALSENRPAGQYPDSWYQGLVSFTDSIWTVNTSTGAVEILKENTGMDVVGPALSAKEDYFIFTNKRDNTLWSLKLAQ